MIEMLELYANNAKIMTALDIACEHEQQLAEGCNITEDIVLKAVIDADSGFGRLSLDTPLGEILLLALDKDFTQLQILTMPSRSEIKHRDLISDDEIMALQIKYLRAIEVDLRDVNSVKEAKNFFANDYVMNNIFFEGDDGCSYGEMFIQYLRIYRNLYVEYIKTFKFLWEETPYIGALALKNALEQVNYEPVRKAPRC